MRVTQKSKVAIKYGHQLMLQVLLRNVGRWALLIGVTQKRRSEVAHGRS
jgi:hypothetical protein